MSEAYPPTLQYPEKQTKRYEKLYDAFKKKFGCAPSFYARAPGRVNIIGEHIDYCGYAVLPMAVEQDMVMAVAPHNEAKVCLANVNHKEYSDFTFDTSNGVVIDKSCPQWYHYFLCGFKGILEHFKMAASKGMLVMTDGTVPRSAGLSSSSALVCCSGLATLHANGLRLTKLELADICMRCEHYVGTIGGGMDQSISFLAQSGKAKLIEFNPIKATDIRLPDGVVFVISNSLAEMNKAASSHFNTRVVECRLACQIIAKYMDLPWRKYRKLGDLQNQLGLSLPDMVELTKSTLHAHPYNKEEVCQILEVTPNELASTSLSENTLNVDVFKLQDRAVHVYSEANRVLVFKQICDTRPEDSHQQLGDLMNESHESCRDKYECSHPDLDRLAQLCRDSGALGCRLTGAGWGGCAVSMVAGNHVEEFIRKVAAGYYAGMVQINGNLSSALFATEPGRGAAIYTIHVG